MFDYSFTSHSLKQFKKLPKKIQLRITNKLDYFCLQENPLEYAEVLTNSTLGQYRFRIGDYRVIFDMKNKTLIIHDVGHRREIYR
jgi:mRNA interferase RelE/StbE